MKIFHYIVSKQYDRSIQEKETIPVIATGRIQYEELLISNRLATKRGKDIPKEYRNSRWRSCHIL